MTIELTGTWATTVSLTGTVDVFAPYEAPSAGMPIGLLLLLTYS